jgi:dihydroflavonol-4-reductase
VGCIGLPKTAPNGETVPNDESAPVSASQMSNHYKLSKWQAEDVAVELAREGAPIIIVNPAAPVGPRTSSPRPPADHCRFPEPLLARLSRYSLNWVHVRDVAEGHILAAQKGNPGERYIWVLPRETGR